MGFWDSVTKSQPLKEIGKFLKDYAPQTAPIVDRIDESLRQSRRENTPVVPAVQQGFARGAADIALTNATPWIVGGVALVAVILFARQKG